MEQESCSLCKYFKQHYSFDSRKIFRVCCGHCTYKRPKTKRPDARICENFIREKAGLDMFVTKEYLSKAILEYFLKLELLPTIYSEADAKKEE